MGACASKFTVMKSASTAPPPAVKCEVEPKEVNLVEQVAVEKDDSLAEEDEAKRRQSLGNLLQEVKSGEEKNGSAESNGKASELVPDDEAEVKAPASIADGFKSKCVEEEIPANQNVETGAKHVEDVSAEIMNLETTEKPQEIEAVEKPETLESEQTEVKKPASDEDIKKEEKPAVIMELETSEKTPEIVENEITGELNPACGAEKKETEVKATENAEIESPKKKPEEVEVTGEQKSSSEAEKKNPDARACEISNKKPDSPEIEKSEKQKEEANTDKNMIEKKPAENIQAESSDKVEDKNVMEPPIVENDLCNKTSETSIEKQKPASDAEKPKVEE